MLDTTLRLNLSIHTGYASVTMVARVNRSLVINPYLASVIKDEPKWWPNKSEAMIGSSMQ